MAEQSFQVDSREALVIRGGDSFLLAARAGARFPLCIESLSGEYCQTIEATDLVAVSAPEGGSIAAALMLMELVRTHHTPLIVLPHSHPGSRRLRYVVSAGSRIYLSCAIERGTHPEQHLLCSSPDLAGITLEGTGEGVVVRDCPPDARIEMQEIRMLTPDI
ncbi:MAG: alpha/beta hydrolase [Methanolinea sp.]|nr:alpha/beta hydrolase [Methanolinea sp.]